MHFSPLKYSQLKSRLKKKYERDLVRIVQSLKKSDTKISEWILNHQSELKEYSPLNWNFLHQLQDFNFLLTLTPELGKDFGPKEEMVFEKWNKSEFADLFLKDLNRGLSLGKASARTLKVLDGHLVTFGERHILKTTSFQSLIAISLQLANSRRERKFPACSKSPFT